MTFALVRSLAFIWVAAVVLASLPAQAEILARQATVSGMTFDYKVILPDGYDADKTYDAMLAFPGGEQHMRIVDRMLEVNW